MPSRRASDAVVSSSSNGSGRVSKRQRGDDRSGLVQTVPRNVTVVKLGPFILGGGGIGQAGAITSAVAAVAQEAEESTGTATSKRRRTSKSNYDQAQGSLLSIISLDRLIAPLDYQVFLRDCFRQCAVHVPSLESTSGSNSNSNSNSGGPLMKRLRDELFDLDPGSILSATSSESIFVWLRNNSSTANNNSLEDDLIQSIEVSDPDTALALHKAGHATYCRAPPPLERHLVSTLLAETGLGCGQYDPSGESVTSLGRGEVEVFMGTAGHVTGWHFDFQENFTIQLSGSKKWTLQRGSVKHPLRGCTPHYRSPESVEPQLKAAHLGCDAFEFGHPVAGVNAIGEQDEVEMKAGDVLYFPAGMWHKVEVLEAGVSINISLMATNYAAVTCQALQHFLLQKDEWRESLVNNSSSDVISNLKTLLRKLPSIIEEFEREGGGAEAILPPAILNPRPLGMHDNCDDDDDDDNDSHDQGDLVDVTAERSKGLPYQCTERQLRQRLRSYRVVRNPLASILRESDIYKYYKIDDSAQEEDEEEQAEVYVLNVNYAGSESQESAIRARILETGSLLSQLFSSTKDRSICCYDLLPDVESWIHSETERSMLGCLVYYGYLVWVPREESGI